jgi:hypothetical protein
MVANRTNYNHFEKGLVAGSKTTIRNLYLKADLCLKPILLTLKADLIRLVKHDLLNVSRLLLFNISKSQRERTMGKIKLTRHDVRIAVSLKNLWDRQIRPTMTQTQFAQKYGFTQNFISQVFNYHTRASHAVICAFAKELSSQPVAIDSLFNEPGRFRK